MHTCTQKDYDQFYPIDSKYEVEFDLYKDSLQCIDWTDDLELRPNNYKELEFFYVPCNYVLNEFGYTGDSVYEKCIPDLESQLQYLGPLIIPMYFNEEVLVTDNFGQESIKRYSKILYNQINEQKPSYFSFDLQTTHLEDETDLVQFGNTDETYFNSPIQK